MNADCEANHSRMMTDLIVNSHIVSLYRLVLSAGCILALEMRGGGVSTFSPRTIRTRFNGVPSNIIRLYNTAFMEVKGDPVRGGIGSVFFSS